MVSGLLTPGHVMIVLVVVLMLFGTKRLPEVGKSLGSSLRGFKQSLDGHEEPDRLNQWGRWTSGAARRIRARRCLAAVLD